MRPLTGFSPTPRLHSYGESGSRGRSATRLLRRRLSKVSQVFSLVCRDCRQYWLRKLGRPSHDLANPYGRHLRLEQKLLSKSLGKTEASIVFFMEARGGRSDERRLLT